MKDDIGQDSATEQHSQTDDKNETSDSNQNDAIPNDCHPAVGIIKERTRGKRKEFYVEFVFDKTKHWCDFVTPALLEHYRIVQDKRRRRRAKNRKKKQ